MNNTPKYPTRLKAIHSGEDELRLILEAYGFIVKPTGQETWLPFGIHRHIRQENSDTMSRAVRYMPDFLAFHPLLGIKFFAYWDAKINQNTYSETFTIEKASYDELLARVQKGERVVVAFKDIDGQWYANWAESLEIQTDLSNPVCEVDDSRQIYLLVAKSSTRHINDFLMH